MVINHLLTGMILQVGRGPDSWGGFCPFVSESRTIHRQVFHDTVASCGGLPFDLSHALSKQLRRLKPTETWNG